MKKVSNEQEKVGLFFYDIFTVETAPHTSCMSGSPIRAALPSGYLANSITMDTDKGGAQCPWLIQAESGQRINVTLINFAGVGEEPDATGTCYQ